MACPRRTEFLLALGALIIGTRNLRRVLDLSSSRVHPLLSFEDRQLAAAESTSSITVKQLSSRASRRAPTPREAHTIFYTLLSVISPPLASTIYYSFIFIFSSGLWPVSSLSKLLGYLSIMYIPK